MQNQPVQGRRQRRTYSQYKLPRVEGEIERATDDGEQKDENREGVDGGITSTTLRVSVHTALTLRRPLTSALSSEKETAKALGMHEIRNKTVLTWVTVCVDAASQKSITGFQTQVPIVNTDSGTVEQEMLNAVDKSWAEGSTKHTLRAMLSRKGQTIDVSGRKLAFWKSDRNTERLSNDARGGASDDENNVQHQALERDEESTYPIRLTVASNKPHQQLNDNLHNGHATEEKRERWVNHQQGVPTICSEVRRDVRIEVQRAGQREACGQLEVARQRSTRRSRVIQCDLRLEILRAQARRGKQVVRGTG
ncbi:hypothetical protein BC629DRAFT_1434130 [Irpex lacteus]|nr:hypothetical protein BC629DRAFT_1434130 [Irpex lacteus]